MPMSTERTRLGWMRLCGLAIVAAAAAVLSFASLRRLAMLGGTPGHLAWLFPLTLDATMAVATSLWVGVDVPWRARRFARVVALATIALSVAGNAGHHALVGGSAWWPVVVGAVPAAVLAAVAHLVALTVTSPASTSPATPSSLAPTPAVPLATVTIQPVDDAPAEVEPPAEQPDVASPEPAAPEVGDQDQADANQPPTEPGDDLASRARALVEAGEAEDRPVGRATLARELGVSQHRARQLLAEVADQRRPALHAVGGG